MSTHRLAGPLTWTAPSDRVVSKALDRQADLFRRAALASDEARQAAERAAAGEQAHHQLRAQALSRGEPDPGPFDSTALDAAASSAAATAAVLQDAAMLARADCLATAVDRTAPWSKAAQARLDDARAKMAKALDVVDAAADVLVSAWAEAALASSDEARLRPKLTMLAHRPALDDLRDWCATPALDALLAERAQEAAASQV